jgi:UDP-2,3-diacylglucosamine pyrophosphatase LpxH
MGRSDHSYRTVWISDLHLGSRGCRGEAISEFLKHVRCRRLYLVGDIIDTWRLKSRWHWPESHNDVLRRLLNHARHETEVIFIPGNHDDAARQFIDLEFGGVKVMPYAIHVGADGKRLLVTHGDQFDMVVQHSKALALLGAGAYEFLLRVNRSYNTVRRWRGKPYWSLSRAIKLKVKRACTFISSFEEHLLREAHRRKLDGVVCGHIHKADHRIELIDGDEMLYYNCGDWVESCTAIVERHDGSMEIIDGLRWLEEHRHHRPHPAIDARPAFSFSAEQGVGLFS